MAKKRPERIRIVLGLGDGSSEPALTLRKTPSKFIKGEVESIIKCS